MLALEVDADAAVGARRAVEPRMHQDGVEIPARWADMGPVEAEARRIEIDRAARGAALAERKAAYVAVDSVWPTNMPKWSRAAQI